jgi:putative membrane protein
MSNALTGIVAALHAYFLVLEMFLWTTPVGQKTFKRTAEQQIETKALAQNQGLYNGFLAAGLVWSYWAGYDVRVFFLVCVVVAGVYGAITASRSILFVQAIPGAAALAATMLWK